MASRLWLLRHGDAEPHGIKEDSQRELTETGRTEATHAGLALAALGSPSVVLTSPRVRAMQTADLAAAGFGGEPRVEQVLGGGMRGDDVLDLVLGNPDRDLLLVGHMPDLSIVVSQLAGAEVGFRTGGLALLRGEAGRWELASLLRPRETKAIAGSHG
jgi:phosphohistidine phosphatase